MAPDWIAAASARGLDRIFLVAPSSTPERLHMTVAASTGFVYAASLMGVTGERGSVGGGGRDSSLPGRATPAGADAVCVGLGVSTGAHAAEGCRVR